MVVATMLLADDSLSVTIDDATFAIPCGAVALTQRHFRSDPPQPEELTNAIGDVLDHLEDLQREMPAMENASLRLRGVHAGVVAAVERGAAIGDDDFVLSRAAAEDVFRTLATEHPDERAHNPGLPHAQLTSIVGACCAIVAIMRGLALTEIVVVP